MVRMVTGCLGARLLCRLVSGGGHRSVERDHAHSPASLGGSSGNVGRDSSFENQLVPGMLTALCLLHEIKCAKVV